MNGKRGMESVILARNLQRESDSYVECMDKFIAKLKGMSGPEAKEEAVAALKRTGVADDSGELKHKIVSRE